MKVILNLRKYVNKIIKNQIEENQKLRIVKSFYLNDFSGFNHNGNKKYKINILKVIILVREGKYIY